MAERLSLIYAVTTQTCAELAASLGTNIFGMSIFAVLLWCAFVVFIGWLIVLLIHRRLLKTWVNGLFHVTLLLSLCLLAFSIRLMQIDDNNIPDGTLMTEIHVVDLSTGEARYAPRVQIFNDYSRWIIGPYEGEHEVEIINWEPRCVWLEEGVIIGNAYPIQIDGYFDMSDNEKVRALRSRNRYYPSAWGAKFPYKYVGSIFTGNTGMETLRDMQVRRPLTEAERERFLAKQTCLQKVENRYAPENCTYNFIEDIEAYWIDYEMEKLGVTERTLQGR